MAPTTPYEDYIDYSILTQILDMADSDFDDETSNPHIEAFFNQAQVVINQLSDARQEGHINKIHQLAQTLQASAQGIGATRVVQRCGEVAASADADKADMPIAILRTDLEETVKGVRRFFWEYNAEHREKTDERE